MFATTIGSTAFFDQLSEEDKKTRTWKEEKGQDVLAYFNSLLLTYIGRPALKMLRYLNLNLLRAQKFIFQLVNLQSCDGRPQLGVEALPCSNEATSQSLPPLKGILGIRGVTSGILLENFSCILNTPRWERPCKPPRGALIRKIHILFTVLHTFLMELARRISVCLNI